MNLDTTNVTGACVTAADLVAAMRDPDARTPELATRVATKMQPLDDVLGGGLRAHDFVLIAGRPGAGKTIMALQWARAVAMQGADAIYVCYEHSPEELFGRLAALEAVSAGREDDAASLDELARRVEAAALGGPRGAALGEPRLADTFDRVSAYAARLTFVQGSSRHTDLAQLDRLVLRRSPGPKVLFVDYIQKVALAGEHRSDDERITAVAEGLKDLAIARNVTVVALAAADKAALSERRLRMHHIRGSSALMYEADVVLVLNEKSVAVSKAHLAYDLVRAEDAKRQIVVSVEKQRNGPADIDIEFTKDYAHYRLDPQGAFVAERLVDDVLYSE
jgi:replicative DNA helicase